MKTEEPILLIGADGMLGTAFDRLLTEQERAFSRALYPDIDLTNPSSVERAIGADTRTVINCSGYTDVDGAETDEVGATAVNGDGVGTLARRCHNIGATLLHFSTDYVFDGQATSPYATDHPVSPVNAYGRSKAAGEAEMLACGCDHLIVRTSWLYAPWGSNFVLTMVKLGRERDELRVVSDQYGRPTSAQYLAAQSLTLLDARARGIYHVTDGGSCNWFEFATAILQETGSACRVTPCSTDQFPRPAARPGYSVLDLSKAEALLGHSGNWQGNLTAVLRSLTDG